MEIDLRVEDGVHPNFSQRIDLHSSSAVRSLSTDLNGAYGNKTAGYNWVLILNSVFNKVSKAYYEQQQPVSIVGRPYKEIPFLLYPFLQGGVSNMLFAESEAGKTWFALRLAISIASGKPFFGYTSEKGLKTLFIDYEDDIEVFTNRVRGLCAGANVPYDEVAPLMEYYKPIGSFRTNVELLKVIISKGKFDLIIIDAGGDAAGGSPSDEEKVLDLFNALEELKCTKLILHHEPKNVVNQASAFYGSMYWKARSRVAWRLEVETREKNNNVIKATIQKRSNLPYIEPIYYTAKFEQGGNLSDDFATYSSLVVVSLDTVSMRETLNPDELILKTIEESGDEGLTESQAAQLVGKDRSSVNRQLQKLKEQGVVQQVKKGRSIIWKVKN